MVNNGEGASKQIVVGLLWTFGERFFAQIVSLIVTIVLSRVLDPTHYGIISIVAVFITFCDIIVTSGFGRAVVQKKEVDELDYNTAFFISLGLALVGYAILFIFSPYIAKFYEMDELTAVLRVMSLRLPLAALNCVQQAHVQRDMQFKKFFISTSFGTIISGMAGIAVVYAGFGVWGLAAQYLTNTIVDSTVLSFVGGWRPKLQFSRDKAKEIFGFGWKLLATDLVANLETDIRSLIVGKVFGAAALAFYDQGKKYPSIIVMNLNSAINKVMLPAYSKSQDDLERLKNMLRKSIQMGAFLLAPLMIGFCSIADIFVRVVLTDKWLGSVPYIQIFCMYFLTRPLETASQQSILAIGKSKITLKIMVIVNAFAVVTVLVAVFLLNSVLLLAVGTLFTTILSMILFMYYTKKYLAYYYLEQFSDLFPPIIISSIMGVIVYFIGKIQLNPLITLLIQLILGICIYIALSVIYKIPAITYILHKSGRGKIVQQK